LAHNKNPTITTAAARVTTVADVYCFHAFFLVALVTEALIATITTKPIIFLVTVATNIHLAIIASIIYLIITIFAKMTLTLAAFLTLMSLNFNAIFA
jgi:hypothetical protein